MFKKIISSIILLIIVILLSGCVQAEVYQKVKRNGNFDISLTIKSESPMILNIFKQESPINPSLQDKYTYEEDETSITYKFTDLDPTKDVIFAESEEFETGIFGYNLSKEFKFPYYYYYFELDLSEEDNGVLDSQNKGLSGIEAMFDEMFKIGYTVEVFGKITETNGNRMEDNKVKFNLGPSENNIYYIEFRDFFISNWLGRLF